MFCRVVDNFGDIGICWRLGRQLAHEHGINVRLWLDDEDALTKLRGQKGRLPWEPEELRVLPWQLATEVASPGAVVIEAFACEPPGGFVEKMTHQNNAPLWINLEYLSAEDWIETCHGLPSPHPRLPLRKFFYFPGFTERSGGLIRETGLLARRNAFQTDPEGREAWWRTLGGDDPWAGRFSVSLFSYEIEGLPEWLERLAGGQRPVRLLVPEGRVLPALLQWFGQPLARPGDALERGSLRCHLLPFMTQPEYDRLLWACDLNVVRGEDSFQRAQWAGRPMVWHVYRQEEETHLVKLDAFLQRYLADTDPALATAVATLQRAWNRGFSIAAAWTALEPSLVAWRRQATCWADRLAEQSDLAGRLVKFSKSAV